MDVRTYLEQQQVHPQLIRAVEEFRNQYPVEEKVKYRVSDPMMPFYGTEILEMGIAALLQKENLLLSGSKATGKKCSGGKSGMDLPNDPLITFPSMSTQEAVI